MGARIDVEWHAFRAGLKPAIRLSAAPGEAEPIVLRYRQLGAAVVTARGALYRADGTPDRQVDLVYVARTPEAACELRAAEHPLLGGPKRAPRDARGACRRVGLLLGYPPCCVEACAERLARRTASLRWRRAPAAQAYLAAREAWVPAPRWQLNDLLFALHAHLVSFEPCRYDCAAALAFAEALHRVLTEVDADATRALEATLRRPVAIDPTGARVFVTLDRGGAAGRPTIRSTEPVTPSDARFRAADAVVLDFSGSTSRP